MARLPAPGGNTTPRSTPRTRTVAPSVTGDPFVTPGQNAAATGPDVHAINLGDSVGDIAGTAISPGVSLFSSIADSVNSVGDFLKFVAWIFHPRNILRAVEFLTGLTLMAFGLHAAMQARGERVEGFMTSQNTISRSGLGRVGAELVAAAKSEAGGKSGRRPRKPQTAPHAIRRTALRQRYSREQSLSERKGAARRKR